MNAITLTQTYNKVLSERNRLLIALSILGGLCVLLGLSNFYLIGRERVIVVPPLVSRDFWVATHIVSDSYLEQMAEFFAGLLLNVTPSSFATRAEHLLQHVASDAYPAIKAQTVTQQLELERRAMSTSFHPTSFKVDRARLLVELKGQLKVVVGNAPLDTQSKTYQLQFVQQQGRLYIKQFSEVPNV